MSVAETVYPSGRGVERLQVVLLLGATGVVTGGLVGLAVGATWAALGGGPLPGVAVGVVVAGAALADAAARRWPVARPLAVGGQVPQAWGRVFGLRLAATLYGARLGVGPLTILTSWAWWAALVVGASLGPWASAGVGALFAVTRTLVTVAAGGRVTSGLAMHHRMRLIAITDGAAAWSVVGLLAVLALAG